MDLNRINISSYLPAMPYVVRELFDKATNIVMNYSDTEAKVVEATNDESWGPPGKLLQELSQLSYSSEHYNEIMGMLWKRCLGQDKRYWRRTYKALLLLNYLIKNGHEKVIISTREHLFDLKSLENFTYHDEQNKDQGLNIRHKVKELIEFVQDDTRMRDERKKAKATRDKYIGMSNDILKKHDYEIQRSTRDRSDEENQNSKSIRTNTSKPAIVTEKPVVDLLGDEIDYAQEIEFGQFQEATSPCNSMCLSSVQPPLWSPSDVFDPFASSVTTPTNLVAPIPPINKPNLTPTIEPTNLWSSAQGKLDISLNNLIPHTRGGPQKSSLPLNQLTSPTNSTQSIFSNVNRK